MKFKPCCWRLWLLFHILLPEIGFVLSQPEAAPVWRTGNPPVGQWSSLGVYSCEDYLPCEGLCGCLFLNVTKSSYNAPQWPIEAGAKFDNWPVDYRDEYWCFEGSIATIMLYHQWPPVSDFWGYCGSPNPRAIENHSWKYADILNFSSCESENPAARDISSGCSGDQYCTVAHEIGRLYTAAKLAISYDNDGNNNEYGETWDGMYGALRSRMGFPNVRQMSIASEGAVDTLYKYLMMNHSPAIIYRHGVHAWVVDNIRKAKGLYLKRGIADLMLVDYDPSRANMSSASGYQTGVRLFGEEKKDVAFTGLLIKYQGVIQASLDTAGNFHGNAQSPYSWQDPSQNSLKIQHEDLSTPTIHISTDGKVFSRDFLRKAAPSDGLYFGFNDCHRLDGSGSSGCKRRTSYWDRGNGSMSALIYNFNPNVDILAGNTKVIDYYFGNEYVPYSGTKNQNIGFNIYNRGSQSIQIGYRICQWTWDSIAQAWTDRWVNISGSRTILPGTCATTSFAFESTYPKDRVGLELDNYGSSGIIVGIVPRTWVALESDFAHDEELVSGDILYQNPRRSNP